MSIYSYYLHEQCVDRTTVATNKNYISPLAQYTSAIVGRHVVDNTKTTPKNTA